MTWQEMFDKAATGMLGQGKKAYDPRELNCVYCDGAGNHCAVGHIMPLDHPGQSYKGNVEALIEAYPDLGEIFYSNTHKESDTINFLNALQQVHDEYPPSEWKELLLELAQYDDLDSTCLKEFSQ